MNNLDNPLLWLRYYLDFAYTRFFALFRRFLSIFMQTSGINFLCRSLVKDQE